MDVFKFGAEENGEAIGDYEVVPRGMLQMTAGSIDSGSMTNKFVRSEFVREFEGQLKTYSLETSFLPVNLSCLSFCGFLPAQCFVTACLLFPKQKINNKKCKTYNLKPTLVD